MGLPNGSNFGGFDWKSGFLLSIEAEGFVMPSVCAFCVAGSMLFKFPGTEMLRLKSDNIEFRLIRGSPDMIALKYIMWGFKRCKLNFKLSDFIKKNYFSYFIQSGFEI